MVANVHTIMPLENSQIVHEMAAHKNEVFLRSVVEATAKFAKAQQKSKSFLWLLSSPPFLALPPHGVYTFLAIQD